MILKAVPCERCGTYTNQYGREVTVTWTQNPSGICRLHPIERGDLVDVNMGTQGYASAEVVFPGDGTGNVILRSVQGAIFSAPRTRVSL